jgi:hypothetical protein
MGLRAFNKVAAINQVKAINIRRASDNTTTDINVLTNGNLDVATATAFCNATTCFVAIWYDQSAEVLTRYDYITHLDPSQGINANQPQLVFNCINTNLPCVTSTGGAVGLVTSAAVGPQDGVSSIPQPNFYSGVAIRTTVATDSRIIGVNPFFSELEYRAAGTAMCFAGVINPVTATEASWHNLACIMNGPVGGVSSVDGTITVGNNGSTGFGQGVVDLFGIGSNPQPLIGSITEAGAWAELATVPAGQLTAICKNVGTYYGLGIGSC